MTADCRVSSLLMITCRPRAVLHFILCSEPFLQPCLTLPIQGWYLIFCVILVKVSSFCNSRQTKTRHSLFHGFPASNLEQNPRSLNGVPAQIVQILIEFWIEPNKIINLFLMFCPLCFTSLMLWVARGFIWDR